ncbi:hypothetical protein CLU79DRAFT_744798 [Phycomyces nitens]|nr:hypothetical protein CLU79DRAFT_744798 [Phycomyces nitens]
MASFAENLVKNLNYPLSLGISDRLSHLSTSLAQSLNLKPQPPPQDIDVHRLAPPAPEQTKGTFEINLIDAKHLAIHDSIKAQVYCVVYYQGNVLSTLSTQSTISTQKPPTTASNSPLDLLDLVSRQANPTWNATATLYVFSR